jgi:hypothetical protein
MFDISFCVLKKWVHYRISRCVRPSSRLHDNSSKAHLIAMKFCTQNCLINISVEFEDENDSSRNGLFIAKNVIIFYAFLYKHWPIPIFANTFSVIIKITTITIIYHSIENFTGYKMVYGTLRNKKAKSPIAKILKQKLLVRLSTLWLIENESSVFRFENFIKHEQRLSGAENLNLSSTCLEILLVVQ